MSIVLGIEMMDREDGEMPNDSDRIVAFSPELDDPAIKYRTMSGMMFRQSTDARYWFSLSDLAIEEFHKIKMGGLRNI